MPIELVVHLLAVGIWLGCVGAEVILELDQRAKVFDDNYVAKLHLHMDLWVEAPAFVAVLISGLLLLPNAPDSAVLGWKVAAGLAAVSLNMICVFLVIQRYKALQAGNLSVFVKTNRLHDAMGYGVLATLAAAFAMGIYLALA